MASHRGADLEGLFGSREIHLWGTSPEQWLAEPIDNTVKALRDAVWNFVLRHRSRKLERHILRGNLNGLPNFLDIFGL